MSKRKFTLEEKILSEIYNPCCFPDGDEFGREPAIIDTSHMPCPYSKITEDCEVYIGNSSYEQNYKREILYWSTAKGRQGTGATCGRSWGTNLYYDIPFNKEIEFQKIQNDFCDFGQAKILPDVPKVPVVEKLFYLFFTNIDKLNKPVAQSLDDLETVKREHLVILYFESALYDLYKNRNLKRDSGLYYHTEEYIQACLKPYIKEILLKYKHRVRDDTFVLRDRLYSQYYVLLV